MRSPIWSMPWARVLSWPWATGWDPGDEDPVYADIDETDRTRMFIRPAVCDFLRPTTWAVRVGFEDGGILDEWQMAAGEEVSVVDGSPTVVAGSAWATVTEAVEANGLRWVSASFASTGDVDDDDYYWTLTGQIFAFGVGRARGPAPEAGDAVRHGWRPSLSVSMTAARYDALAPFSPVETRTSSGVEFLGRTYGEIESGFVAEIDRA